MERLRFRQLNCIEHDVENWSPIVIVEDSRSKIKRNGETYVWRSDKSKKKKKRCKFGVIITSRRVGFPVRFPDSVNIKQSVVVKKRTVLMILL